MRKITQLSSLVLSLVACPALLAQTSAGALTGAVLSKSGAPIVGAKVTLKSKALFSPKLLITDAKGEWREMLLPPGEYEIVGAKDGFVSSSAKNVRVGIGGTIRQDLFLSPIKEQGATVEVIAVSSAVDKTDSKTASNFSAEALATQVGGKGDRGFTGALDLAPGVVSETPSGAPAIRGGSLTATNFTVNGADVKNQNMGGVTDAAHGGQGAWYVEDNIEDVQVVLSPLNARFGRAAGGSVNIVTKTGGNDFSGSIRSSFGRQSWDATNTINPVTQSDSMNRSYNVVLSGPIIPDRLWFNVASILTPQSSNTNYLASHPTVGIYPTMNAGIDSMTATSLAAPYAYTGPMSGLSGYGFGIGQNGASVSQTNTNTYIEAKITGAVTPDHILEYAFTRSNSTKTNTDPYDDLWHSTRLISLGSKKDTKTLDSINYRGTLSSNLFVEAKFSKNEDKVNVPQGDPNYGGGQEAVFQTGLQNDKGAKTIAAADAIGDMWYGYQPFGPWSSPTPQSQKNTSYNLDVKYILDTASGSHEMDFGIDGFSSEYSDNSSNTTTDLGANNRQFVIGGFYQNIANPESNILFPVINYTSAPGVSDNRTVDPYFSWPTNGLAPTMIQFTGPAGGSTKTKNQALFANDTWTINSHWNAMLGLRFEKQSVNDSTGAQLISVNDFSPRLQIRYDIKGDSRSLITFTAAQFQGDIPQAFIGQFATNPQSSGTVWGMNSIDGGKTVLPLAGDPNDPTYGVRVVNFATLVNPANYGTAIETIDKSKTNQIDSNLKPQTLDELTLGYSRTFESGSNISITYVNRNWHNLWALGQDYVGNDVKPGNVVTFIPNVSYGIMNHYFNSSALTREYNALEMIWNIKTKGIWSFNGSWSYSRLTGNDEQGDDASGASALYNGNAVIPTPLFNNSIFLNSKNVPVSTYAPNGRLLNDLTNRIRMGATATIPFAKGGLLTLNWQAHYSDGAPFGSMGLNSSDGIALSSWGLKDLTAGTNKTVVGGGASGQGINGYVGGRRPFEQNGLAGVDFRAGFQIPLPLWRVKVFGDVVVTNFFNHIDAGYSPAFTSVFGTNPAAPGTISLPLQSGSTPGFGQTTNDSRLYENPRTVTASLGFKF